MLGAEKLISDESFDAHFSCSRYDEIEWTKKLKNELRNHHNTRSYNQSYGYSSFESNFNVNYTEEAFDKENKTTTTAQQSPFNENDAIFGCGLGSSNPPLNGKNSLTSRTRINLKNELDAISTAIVRLFGFYPTRIPNKSYLLFVKVFNPYIHGKSSAHTDTDTKTDTDTNRVTGAIAGAGDVCGSVVSLDIPSGSRPGPALIPIPVAVAVNPGAAKIDTSIDRDRDRGRESKVSECYLPPLPPLYISPIADSSGTDTQLPSLTIPKPSALHSALAVGQCETDGRTPQSTTTPHSDTSSLPVSPTPHSPTQRSPLITIGTILVTPDATYSQLLSLVDALISPHTDLFLPFPLAPSSTPKAVDRNGSSCGVTIQRSASRNGIDEKTVRNDTDIQLGNSDTAAAVPLKDRLTYSCYRRDSAHCVEYSRAAVEVMSEVFLSCTDFIRQVGPSSRSTCLPVHLVDHLFVY